MMCAIDTCKIIGEAGPGELRELSVDAPKADRRSAQRHVTPGSRMLAWSLVAFGPTIEWNKTPN
jgi:hypothetical protein